MNHTREITNPNEIPFIFKDEYQSINRLRFDPSLGYVKPKSFNKLEFKLFLFNSILFFLGQKNPSISLSYRRIKEEANFIPDFNYPENIRNFLNIKVHKNTFKRLLVTVIQTHISPHKIRALNSADSANIFLLNAHFIPSHSSEEELKKAYIKFINKCIIYPFFLKTEYEAISSLRAELSIDSKTKRSLNIKIRSLNKIEHQIFLLNQIHAFITDLKLPLNISERNIKEETRFTPNLAHHVAVINYLQIKALKTTFKVLLIKEIQAKLTTHGICALGSEKFTDHFSNRKMPSASITLPVSKLKKTYKAFIDKCHSPVIPVIPTNFTFTATSTIKAPNTFTSTVTSTINEPNNVQSREPLTAPLNKPKKTRSKTKRTRDAIVTPPSSPHMNTKPVLKKVRYYGPSTLTRCPIVIDSTKKRVNSQVISSRRGPPEEIDLTEEPEIRSDIPIEEPAVLSPNHTEKPYQISNPIHNIPHQKEKPRLSTYKVEGQVEQILSVKTSIICLASNSIGQGSFYEWDQQGENTATHFPNRNAIKFDQNEKYFCYISANGRDKKLHIYDNEQSPTDIRKVSHSVNLTSPPRDVKLANNMAVVSLKDTVFLYNIDKKRSSKHPICNDGSGYVISALDAKVLNNQLLILTGTSRHKTELTQIQNNLAISKTLFRRNTNKTVGHKSTVTIARIYDDLFLTGSKDQTVRLWDPNLFVENSRIDTSEEVLDVYKKDNILYTIFARTTQTSILFFNFISFYDVRTKKESHKRMEIAGKISSFLVNDNQLLIGTNEGNVLPFNLSTLFLK
jgi:hypothetical protein